MANAYNAGDLGKDEGVCDRFVKLYEEILGTVTVGNGHKAIRIVDIDWSIIDFLSQKMPHLNIQTDQAKEFFERYDTFLFIPRSPIQELIVKK
jgi:hypothetical protein